MVWITQILYHNRIYPENAFEERKFLDTIIVQARVPLLEKYLQNFSNEMISVLVTKESGGKVHSVVVIVYQESSLHVVKRYVINFGQFVGLAGQISSLEFLEKQTEVHLAKINLPNFGWNEIYSSLRSLIYFHSQELKRTQESRDQGFFYKLLLNSGNLMDLAGDKGRWVKLLSEEDSRTMKFVPIGEISTGFVCFDLHNEYLA